MVQAIIVAILFVGAVAYLINIFRKQLKSNSSCGSAACKCEPGKGK